MGKQTKIVYHSELIGELPDGDRFQRILRRERALADRGARSFSLLTFRVAFRNEHPDWVRSLISVLDDAIRVSDEMGWFSDDELGVVLLETPIEGARVLAQRVAHTLADARFEVDYALYEYPSEGRERTSDPSTGEAVERETDTDDVRELHLYLAPPVPGWKRALDLFGASLMLLVTAPLFAFIAAMIKIASPGPVFFKQERIGYKMAPFTLWKFRTMHVDSDRNLHRRHFESVMAAGTAMVKLDGRDPRVIRGGGILRRTYLDELPQLINVFKGEMSLVGPRPPIRYEVEHYAQWQRRRFDTLPGLTGLWQVSGKNRTTFQEMMRLDIAYQRNPSLWRDLWIALKTVPAIASEKAGLGRDADAGEASAEEELETLASASAD